MARDRRPLARSQRSKRSIEVTSEELQARLLHTIAFGFPGRTCRRETIWRALMLTAFEVNREFNRKTRRPSK